jgi:hypothetical protein
MTSQLDKQLRAIDAVDFQELPLAEIPRRLRADGIGPGDLASLLEHVVAGDDIPRVNRIVAIGFHDPSPALVPIVSRLLESGDDRYMPEDLAELLGELRDARAVPALVTALARAPDWDFDGRFGEKIVRSLAAIDTPEGNAAIERAIDDERRHTWMSTAHSGALSPAAMLRLGRRFLDENLWSHYAEPLFTRIAALDTPEAWSLVEDASHSEDEDLGPHARALLAQRPK